MKGTILKCIQELVSENHGPEIWAKVLDNSSYPTYMPILATADIPDEDIYSVLGCLQTELGVDAEYVFAAFAEYWMTTYAPRVYARLIHNVSSSREFLLGLDALHVRVAGAVVGAKPPRYKYEWEGPDTLIMHYYSERGLIDLMCAMARALGKSFGDDIEFVKKIDDVRLRIKFKR